MHNGKRQIDQDGNAMVNLNAILKEHFLWHNQNSHETVRFLNLKEAGNFAPVVSYGYEAVEKNRGDEARMCF